MTKAIYARVSSEAQEKQQTIQSQLAELRASAEAQGLGLPVEFVDDGYSGTMLERPGLDRLRDAVAAGEVDTILCLCPDRLARNYLYQGILLEEFEKHGARVVFLNQPAEDTPENRLLVQIQGAVSEYERTKILDRTRRGRQHKARQGLMPGGQAPYGYDYVPGDGPRWRVNDEEAAVVRELFRLLNEDGRTLSSIAKELVRKGIRTKRGGLTWGYSSLHRILKNEAYAGTAHFGKDAPAEPKDRRSDGAYRRRLKTSQRRRDRAEWIEVPVPAIIDRETFDRAQERLEENAHFAPRNNKCNFYLLRGLLKCGHCGYSLIGQRVDRNTYYHCRGGKPLGLRMTEKCNARSVRTDRIEPVVWEAVKRLVDDPQVILGQLDLEQDDLEQHAASADDTRKALQKRLAELGAEEMQVVRLFRGGKIGEAVVDAQLQEIGRERQGLEEQLQAAVDALEAQDRLEDDGLRVREFCANFRDSFIGSTGEEKQQVLRLLVDRVEVDPDGDRGKLHGMIPLPVANPALLSHCQPWAEAHGACPVGARRTRGGVDVRGLPPPATNDGALGANGRLSAPAMFRHTAILPRTSATPRYGCIGVVVLNGELASALGRCAPPERAAVGPHGYDTSLPWGNSALGRLEMDHLNRRDARSAGCVALLILLACAAAAAAPVELTELRSSQAAVQTRLSSRADCLAWYRFGPVPAGLTFEPAPEKDALTETAGSFDGQRATRIFHGMMKGPAREIPATGFTLCCWLKLNKLEKVDRGGYQRSDGGLMASGSGYYNGWRLTASPDSGGISFAIGRPEGSTGLSSSGFLTPGAWHHVAVTWDHKTLALWIDGTSRAETSMTTTYTPSAALKYFRIGECNEGTGVLDFEIADLGFFSSALPETTFEALGNPDAVMARRLSEFLRQIPASPSGSKVDAAAERRYRLYFEPLLALKGCDDSPAFREARSYARWCVAESLRRSGAAPETEQAYRQLADDDTAMLHLRARAMLALGDMRRDRKEYSAARREYQNTLDFFTGKHEEFRTEALERLRDVETLADGQAFRSERQRRIDRLNRATPWFTVAPDGADANPGTAARPFRTLERARDALRERRKHEALPPGGVAIVLKGGVYPRLKESFTLSAEDSGTAAAPVVYCAAPGARPILRAGQAVTGFRPLTDSPAAQRIPAAARPFVQQVDLRACGVTDFGKLTPRGTDFFGGLVNVDTPAHLELFLNGKPMSLARWPNDTPKMSERFALIETGDQETVQVDGRTMVKDSNLIYYSNPRQDAWANEPDPWLFGYWQYAYFSAYRRLLGVEPDKKRMRVELGGPGQHPDVVKGSPYQGINLLCELDSPGEWYLDRATGIVYFWPPKPLAGSEVVVSMLETPVVKMENTSHVILRGLTLEAGRHHGVTIKDGEDVLLAGCTVRDMGCKGVEIAGGHGDALVGCDLAYLGNAGVILSGGDLPTLEPSGHVVENCHIHHFATWNRGTYQPAISVSGVGVRMSHNLIHDAPQQAFLLGGNDHVTEYNEVHDVTHEAGDAGAWYMYGDVAALAERGNVVRYNYWHHLPYNETLGKYHTVCRMGVYIDNVNGGVTVYGNVFSRVDVSSGAVFFGGSDDIVENNIFHRCRVGVQMDDRSWVYGKAYKNLDANLASMKVNEPPWSVRYPRLATIKPHTEDLTLLVRGNVVARNIAQGCDTFLSANATTARYARIERNWEKGDPGLRNADAGDFGLKPGAPALTASFFEPLPLQKIGLYNDSLRASWPVVHPSGNYETLTRDTTKIEKAERKPLAKMPVCRATPRTAEIRVDGVLDPKEWGGLDPAQGFVLARNPDNAPTKARPSVMWLRRDAENLYLALRNDLEPGAQALPKGNSPSFWGDADIAEVIFEGVGGDWWPSDKGHGPLFYLVGDSAGVFDSYAVAGLPKARADGLRGAVQYAAAAQPGGWTAEWRVPLSALGLDPKTAQGCCFNVGVHKPRTPNASDNDKWAVWTGAQGPNWQVWTAGWLSLQELPATKPPAD